MHFPIYLILVPRARYSQPYGHLLHQHWRGSPRPHAGIIQLSLHFLFYINIMFTDLSCSNCDETTEKNYSSALVCKNKELLLTHIYFFFCKMIKLYSTVHYYSETPNCKLCHHRSQIYNFRFSTSAA